jgi:two-component system phosphate regulon sensor histidine kinase PhoR
MSLSRVEINEHVRPRGHADLDRILSGVADALAVRAEGRGMTFDLQCPDDLPAVTGDTDQLTQVFHNLVDNAIKYGRADTPVRIAAQPVGTSPGGNGGGVSVSVADQGDGISSIHLPRLTERFYRIDEGRSRRLGGTGLGLAIVKHIVSRHRGQIRIESREGEGTTVTVFLPTATPGVHAPDVTKL